MEEIVAPTNQEVAPEKSLKACTKETPEKKIVRNIVMGYVCGKRVQKMIVRDLMCESELLKVLLEDELEYNVE